MSALVVMTSDQPDRRSNTVAVPIRTSLDRFAAAAPHRAGVVPDEAEFVSALIADVYDASLDPNLWVDVLRKSAQFIGGAAASINVRDSVKQTGNADYHVGSDPQYERLYFDKYIKFDPCGEVYFHLDVGAVTSNSLLIPPEEFFATRFYKEWVRPQGLIDNVFALLEKSLTTAAIFCVFRDERDGLADDAARRRMSLIVPHMQRAVMIGQATELKTAQAATLAETLDGLSAGMFLVDAAARIVHANASGYAMLEARDVLRPANGRLAACDQAPDQALREVFAAAGGGDAAVGTKGISVPLTARGGEHYVAHVLPLTSGERRRAGASYAAVAAVFVHKAQLAVQSPPEAIAKAYGLTPTELRVLFAVVQVGGVSETADALGIGEATVKTHLQRLFGKTGANRQSDLIKLVAGFSNPLVG